MRHCFIFYFKDMKLGLLIALLAGAVAGLLGALCGVGGGIVMVPAFTLALGMEQKQAVASSLAVIVVTALIATSNNAAKSDLIQWKVVALTSVGAAAAAWVGSDLMKQLSNIHLTRIFAIMLIIFGFVMLFSKK